MKRKAKIAVHVQSEVQFFSLAPLIFELKKQYTCVEILVDDFSGDKSGYREMAKGVHDLLNSVGLNPKKIKELKNEFFDVYLTPYIDEKINARCYLKYEYGTLNIKPSLTYIPSVMEKYHGFLCQSTVTTELLKVYGATFPVENLRFYGKKRTAWERNGKKYLLFAPTYNDQDDVFELMEMIAILKEKYYVVIKGHHGTGYLSENFQKRDMFEKMADEYYDSRTSLSDLIINSDVCLFGNSSAIGEALYAGVPCAIFAKDLDYFKMGDMHTTQYKLVQEGVLPYTDRIDEVVDIVGKALTKKYRLRQSECSQKLFPQSFKTGVNGYIKVIDYFINDKLAREYCGLHDYVVADRARHLEEKERERREEEENSRKRISYLTKEIEERDRILLDNAKKKLYKIADKLYKMEGRILNGKS